MKKCLLSLIFLVSYGHNAFASAGPAAAASAIDDKSDTESQSEAEIEFHNLERHLEDMELKMGKELGDQNKRLNELSPEGSCLEKAPDLMLELGATMQVLLGDRKRDAIKIQAQNIVLKKLVLQIFVTQQRQGKILNELLAQSKKQSVAEAPPRYIPIQVQPRLPVAVAQNPMAQAASK